MRSMFFFLFFVYLFRGAGGGEEGVERVPGGGGGRRNWLADTCAFVLVPLIVINTLVIVYELVLG